MASRCYEVERRAKEMLEDAERQTHVLIDGTLGRAGLGALAVLFLLDGSATALIAFRSRRDAATLWQLLRLELAILEPHLVGLAALDLDQLAGLGVCEGQHSATLQLSAC